MRDKRILELLIEQNKSPEDIGDELGLDPIEVVQRAKELLDAKDIFTVLEQKQMLIYQLKGLYARASALLNTMVDEKSWPKGVEALTKLIETTYKIQVEQEEQNARDLDEITKSQAAVLVQVVQLAYNRARDLLVAEHPDVDPAKLDTAFADGLVHVQRQYEIEGDTA